jgi:5-methylcytosine-specific restriction enzyme subunit McrC
VSAMQITWQATGLTGGTSAMLPLMATDLTIAWPRRRLILDCKYYREALAARYDALKFRPGNLYQLNAYLTNQAAVPGWEEVEGMLLYPANGYTLDHSFTLHGRHRIRVATLDLAQPWPAIEGALLGLLDGTLAQGDGR